MKFDSDFYVGDWIVRPQRDCIERGDRVMHLAPKAMSVLCCLIRAEGQTVARQEFFETVWPGCEVSDDALTQRIVEIRKAFGDSPRNPEIIETIPKIGFRLIPPVVPVSSSAKVTAKVSSETQKTWPTRRLMIGALFLLLLATFTIFTPSETNNHSVAVLSFTNHSEQDDNLHMADAIHEELLTRLASIASLKVIAHTSVEKYRDRDLPLQQIAEELGVASVLAGSVQIMGNHLRIRTQLVDASSGEYLWAESFDRELTARNFFTIQSEIAEQVAAALETSLTPEESVRIAEIPTENFDAYRLLLSGHVALEEGTTGSIDRALGHYEQALRLNPEFPQAHLAIARAYTIASEEHGIPQSKAHAQMEQHSRMALSINPKIGHAYKYLGQVRMEQGRLQEAETLYRKALQLDPGNVFILHGLGLTLRMLGRAEECIRYYDRAVELDPLSPFMNESRGSLLRDLGRFEEAERQYLITLKIDPEYNWTYWGLGTLHWSMGNPDEAISWFRKGARITPHSDIFLSWLALMYLERQQDDLARAVLDEALALVPLSADNDAVVVEELFRIYHGLDDSGLPDGRQFIPRHLHGSLVGIPARELLDGHYAAAVNQYEKRYPNISTLEVPIDAGNYQAAIYLAFALDRLGEKQRASALLDRAETALKGMRRLGIHGFWIADAQIQAVRKDHDGSLERLETAVQEGWRNLWRFYLAHDPILQTLSMHPEFQALASEVRDSMIAPPAERIASRVSADRTIP